MSLNFTGQLVFLLVKKVHRFWLSLRDGLEVKNDTNAVIVPKWSESRVGIAYAPPLVPKILEKQGNSTSNLGTLSNEAVGSFPLN